MPQIIVDVDYPTGTHPLTVPSAVRITGWAKTTLLDYPGKVASSLFLQGCNYRCPYCHNPELALPSTNGDQRQVNFQEIFFYLTTYRRMLDGVCITGGEPLLQHGVFDLCRDLRDLGLEIKLDTNGSFPDRLGELLDASLLDYVALDVKAPPGKLEQMASRPHRGDELVGALEECVELLRDAGIPHELRTTVVPGLLDADDCLAIGSWFEGSPRYVLQQFRKDRTLDPTLQDRTPYPPEYFRELAYSLSDYFPDVVVRGVE